MRFSCGSCDAQYSIADEKVRDRVLRVKCKRCSSPIVIEYQPEDDFEPEEQALDDATQVVRQDDVRRAIEAGEPVGIKSAPPAVEAKEWFFLEKGQEVGPFTLALLSEHAKSGRLTPRTYLWRDGMPDWGRLEAVEPLAELLALLPSDSKPVEPPSPVADELEEDLDDDKTDVGAFAIPDEDEEAQMAEPEKALEPEPLAASLADHFASEAADEPVDEGEGDLSDLLAKEAAVIGGAAAHDPFASVPDDPDFDQSEPGEATNAIIKASGANERRTGRIVAVVLLLVVAIGAALWLSGKSEERVIPQVATKVPEKSAIDWAEIDALDDSAMGILSGETKKQKEAQQAAAARRRARDNDPFPKDVDNAGALKRARTNEPTVELSPQQQAQLARMREERAAGGGPGSAGPRRFVDTGFEVNKASGDGPDPQAVAKKVGEAQPAVGRCVSNALRRNPSQKVGKVVVVATIGGSGVVTRAEFREDRYGIAGTELGNCVRKVVKNIVFPSFDGDAIDLEIPFVLSGG